MEPIRIRSVQHYLYCPHRWGLIEIDQAWAENAYVVKGNSLHKKVHEEQAYTLRGKTTYTAVTVWNQQPEYQLYGVTDCIEAEVGDHLIGHEKKLCIVEYKPTQPEDELFRFSDAMQVFAQKICVDAIFGGDCEAVLYYGNVRKRIKLPFQEQYQEYDEKLKQTLQEMRAWMKQEKIPPILPKQKCKGCSMKDLCMPQKKKKRNFQQEVTDMLGGIE